MLFFFHAAFFDFCRFRFTRAISFISRRPLFLQMPPPMRRRAPMPRHVHFR